MLTLEQAARQLESARDLHSIARAMKALSAVRIRHSRRAVESLERYGRTVELALQASLRNRPPGVEFPDEPVLPRTGAVVFGSDLGLAGRFNTRITDFALERLGESCPDPRDRFVLAVGSRVAATLEGAGQPVSATFPAPDSIEAVVHSVQDLSVAIEEMRARHEVERFHLYYNHYHSGATYRPSMVRLLPLNAEWLSGLERRSWPTGVLPRFRIEWEELFSVLVREHLFVSLFEAGARSQAAENASRLASMEAAERRIEERIGQLQGSFNQQRQQRITEELLDLVTGWEALRDRKGIGHADEDQPGGSAP